MADKHFVGILEKLTIGERWKTLLWVLEGIEYRQQKAKMEARRGNATDEPG